MKINVGTMPCPDQDCESHQYMRPVVIKCEDTTGVLSYNCDICGSNQYAKLDQPIRAKWISRYCQDKADLIASAERLKRGNVHAMTAQPAQEPAQAAAEPQRPQRRGLVRQA